MKKINLLLLIFLMGALTTSIKADEQLYMYTQNGQNTSFLLDDVRSLTFAEESMSINKTDGATTSYNYDALRFFSLKLYDFFSTNIRVATDNMFTVSPNPVVDVLTVNIKTSMSTVTLFNLQGQKMFEEICSGTQAIIPMSNLSAGIYFVQVSDNENINTVKLIKK